MPKDLIHIKVAEVTADKLAGTRYSTALSRQQSGLLLGSVFHDALFYGVTTSAKPLEKISHTMHGAKGQDTYAILRMQAEHIQSSPNPDMAVALFVGLASHVFADIVMHPMVWHFTGDYYASNAQAKSRARQRHRAMESLMDMVACPEMLGRAKYSIWRHLRRVGDEMYNSLPIATLANMAGVSEKETRQGLRSAWRVFSILQALYPIKTLAKTLHAISPWLPNSATEITTLFYAPQLLKLKDVLNNIAYKHPVTGEDETTTLSLLIDLAAERASRLCQSVEAGIFGDEPLIFPGPGPSMDTGISGISTLSMTHFASPSFPELP